MDGNGTVTVPMSYTKPEWISVKDRLPEKEQAVLTYGSRGRFYVAWWDKRTSRWVWLSDDDSIMGYVWPAEQSNPTHWTPLPDPPSTSEDTTSASLSPI